MSKKILLTSFATWLSHHKSNSSDDLLTEIAKFNDIDGNFNPKSKIQNPKLPVSLILLRQLPVDVQLASDRVIAKIAEINPDAIICCGMAESRTNLTVESTATCGDVELKSTINLEELLMGLSLTQISHDAGKFVCEGLYYSVLQYLSDRQLQIPCIFVHIPLLNANNLTNIIADFNLIIQKLAIS